MNIYDILFIGKFILAFIVFVIEINLIVQEWLYDKKSYTINNMHKSIGKLKVRK